MRALTLTIGTLSLLALPLTTLAASASTDSLLQKIDAVFGTAGRIVQESSLDRGTKAQVSNVLKTRHDTVKNSIGNIR